MSAYELARPELNTPGPGGEEVRDAKSRRVVQANRALAYWYSAPSLTPTGAETDTHNEKPAHESDRSSVRRGRMIVERPVADQRKAISGLRESVEAFKESVEGASAKDVMALVLMTQYFDTLKEIGAQAR